MDTSKKYIEMCENATEIQKIWQLDVVDYLYYPDIGEVVMRQTCDDNSPDMPETPIWLPRQDQLWELHTPSTSAGYSAYGLGRMFGLWLYACRKYTHSQGFDSMEQHLLAFVMAGSYGKRWNGRVWAVCTC